ncbi:MAG: hypothetical protein QM802_23545 [Agriterribacter sp.]
MNKTFISKPGARNSIYMGFVMITITSLFLFSFGIRTLNDDFLKALGLEKTEADKKITNSILGGYVDAYGLKNAKNIAVQNRTAVVKDLLLYAKKYMASEAFKAAYTALKQYQKPHEPEPLQTPEQMRTMMIENGKTIVETAEKNLKAAKADLKPIFEEALRAAKENLKNAENPDNKNIKAYTQNYPALLKSMEQSNAQRTAEWEAAYPSDPSPFIKKRLLQFLEETKDIDFNAALTDKNGKKVFVNPAYESKSNRWKMAFRAGKEVVEPARQFVQEWIKEIENRR